MLRAEACLVLDRRARQLLAWEPEGQQGLRPFLSLSASLLTAFPGCSLTSLIYGEQSEKTSPSDISLEMEHKDKVSARVGLGPEGSWLWTAALPCAGRSTLTLRGLAASDTPPGNVTFDTFLSFAKAPLPHQKDGAVHHSYRQVRVS